MLFRFSGAAFAVTFLLVACFHSKEGELSANEEVRLDAPPAVVWGAIGDYYGLHSWHPLVNSTQASGKDKVRILILEDSGARVYEKMTSYEDGASYSYVMTDPGPLPVQDYASTVAVEADGDGSKVVWSGSFNAADGQSPDDAVKTISGVYRAGLDNLAKTFD